MWCNSRAFSITIGLHQGSVLSLYLFALVMNMLIGCVHDEVLGVSYTLGIFLLISRILKLLIILVSKK